MVSDGNDNEWEERICWQQIKKKEEIVTITLSKSDHEKVKQLLNIS